jgi:hypothetical protein
MTRSIKSLLTALTFLGISSAAAPVLASDDSDADAPHGFTDVMNATRGVIVRVPVNALGYENTDAAEMRFFQKDTQVTRATDPRAIWEGSIKPSDSAAVRGTNLPHEAVGPTGRDSSTWGWYDWWGTGWAYPYYFSYWYPTFYWGGNYWQYSYYWNWYYPGYTYYYYYWWW